MFITSKGTICLLYTSPFLEQHTELTNEDEKLLAEIMATESDWYRTAEEAAEKPRCV